MFHPQQTGVGGIFLSVKSLSTSTTSKFTSTSKKQWSRYAFFSSATKPLVPVPISVCIEDLVHAHIEEVLRMMNTKDALKREEGVFNNPNYEGQAAEFPWLPGYMVKLNAEARIAGGELLRRCIQDAGLNLLKIPRQTLYEIPQMYHKHSDVRTLCIAEKIEGKLGKDLPIYFPHAVQLLKLIEKTGIADLKWRNLVHCPGGEIALIDTETFIGNPIYALDSLLWGNTCDKKASDLIREKLEEARSTLSFRM